MSTHGIHTPAEVAKMIEGGRVLLLAGDEALFAQLPKGRWIGGTSANFMGAEGGVTEQARLFVTDITEHAAEAEVRTYTLEGLREIGKHYKAGGFAALIVPGLSAIHGAFAKEVQGYEGVFNNPLVGWISGVHVSEIGKRAPKVFAGSPTPLDNQAAALHVALPQGYAAKLDIVNLFKQGSGEDIVFDAEGFETQGNCSIGGKPANLAAYIAEKGIDTKLPLVADYNGAMVNVSIQAVDAAAGKVAFYAPVFKGMKYRFADPVQDYVGSFNRVIGESPVGSVAFSCNCILNFLYAELEKKKTGVLVGPITFGEIAYMLLNQTLVYLSIEKVG